MARLVADPDREGDVLVAPATPPGASALAVVRLTGPAGLTRSVESSRASARSRATVFPVPGTTRRAATSARGTRTNRRDAIRGCGTVRRRVAICSLS